jgi:serine/threonine protein phosphatase PrpC
MNSHILSINIEASNGNGEDSHLINSDVDAEFVVLGVFDGLGGRSAGFDGKTGGQIASEEATQIAKKIFGKRKGKLSQDIATELQANICKSLKNQAELKMGKSRLSGTLTGKRLCTTIALASIPKQADPESKPFEISLAWMGDSRVYFLSPKKGLQQLTVDDLEVEKDAFQMIREDSRMSQYLTADIPSDWQIHFYLEKFEEKGCVLVCTDGCFQYLPAPWDFEKLLLETLIKSSKHDDWEELLKQKYEEIKQDDVSLTLYSIGFSNFDDIKNSYTSRLESLSSNYNSALNSPNQNDLWNSYCRDYEARLITRGYKKTTSEDNAPENSVSEDFVNEHPNPNQAKSKALGTKLRECPTKSTASISLNSYQKTLPIMEDNYVI